MNFLTSDWMVRPSATQDFSINDLQLHDLAYRDQVSVTVY